MLTHRRDSGLLVPAQAMDEKAIDRALQRLDPRFVLTSRVSRRYQCVVYGVVLVQGDQPAVPWFEWTDDYSRPLPLSSALLDEAQKLRPRGGVSAQEAMAANEAAQERAEAETRAELDEIAADIGPRISETRSALLHRGQHLRRSRDRRRARGENV